MVPGSGIPDFVGAGIPPFVCPEECEEVQRRISAAISGWDCAQVILLRKNRWFVHLVNQWLRAGDLFIEKKGWVPLGNDLFEQKYMGSPSKWMA